MSRETYDRGGNGAVILLYSLSKDTVVLTGSSVFLPSSMAMMAC